MSFQDFLMQGRVSNTAVFCRQECRWKLTETVHKVQSAYPNNEKVPIKNLKDQVSKLEIKYGTTESQRTN